VDARYLLVKGDAHYQMSQNIKLHAKHVDLFVRLALLVLEGGSKCCPNVGAKFRNNYLSHMKCGCFPP
jgi:hypothetical protein